MYAHYSPAPVPFYNNQYAAHQRQPVVDQCWHLMQQFYGIQGSNSTSTSQQYSTNGQDGYQQETQNIQMTEHNTQADVGASMRS
eukprot:10107200-Ditylum_brightwellii.AAC.2